MHEEGIKAIWMKKYRSSSVKLLEQELRDILKRNFSLECKNEVWVTDITYKWTSSGFVYLSSVMELYSRKIISWEVSERLGTRFVLRMIRKAKEGLKKQDDKTTFCTIYYILSLEKILNTIQSLLAS